jgi:hypothetical protein
MVKLTNGASKMSNQATSKDSPNATFSQALEAGVTHCGWLIGPTTDKYGQDRALASHSVSQERAAALTMSDTYGPLFGGSSPSANLQESMASRLRVLMDANGSPEYTLTWKAWDMFAGLQICALRASPRPTSDSGCGGWPTTSVRDMKGGYEGGRIRNGEISTDTLDVTAMLSAPLIKGWPTAAGRDGKDCSDPATWKEYRNPDGTERNRYDQLPRVAALTTPAQSGGPAETGKQGECLPSGYPTPRMGSEEGYETRELRKGHTSALSYLESNVDFNFTMPDMTGWKLNPRFSAWLMGYPKAWTEAGLRSIQKHSRSRKGKRVVSPCSEDTATP